MNEKKKYVSRERIRKWRERYETPKRKKKTLNERKKETNTQTRVCMLVLAVNVDHLAKYFFANVILLSQQNIFWYHRLSIYKKKNLFWVAAIAAKKKTYLIEYKFRFLRTWKRFWIANALFFSWCVFFFLFHRSLVTKTNIDSTATDCTFWQSIVYCARFFFSFPLLIRLIGDVNKSIKDLLKLLIRVVCFAMIEMGSTI